MLDPTWKEVAPGIWKAVLGTPEPLSPLGVVGAEPRQSALEIMETCPFPLPAPGDVETVSGRTVLRLPLEETEDLFGLGLQFFRVSQRGRTRTLRVNSDPRQDTGETHAPVPFLLSSRGYGLLVNTGRIVSVYCGSTVRADSERPPTLRDRGRDPDWEATPLSDVVEIVFSGPGAAVFVFAGPSLLDVVRRYNLFCGGGALPPRWGLGFWHRVPTQFTAEEAVAEAEALRQREFSCDVIGLEPGWHSRSYPCTYEWAPDRFPQPQDFLERMRAASFRVNLWEHPYVSPEAEIYPALAPLSGSHTVWGGLAPDYTLPEARRILMEQHEREHVARGVSGYKLDECDGSELTGASWMFPAHATFPSGADGEQMRQVYGLLLQKMTLDLFRRHDRRTYGLVRASGAGASALPYVLYSDLYDHWEFVRALCNSGFCGLLWAPEVRDAASAEEWVRRMQTACFSPLMLLNAWASGTKPWSFPEVAPIVQKTIQLRMRLLPYLYSAFARYYFDGTPPFRAMALEPDIPADARGLDDQYLMGDSLLVAPLFAGETERRVYLPAGDWYDFETGERYEGGGWIVVAAGLEKIPAFARDGAIVPLMPPLPHTPRAGEVVPLEIRHYGTAPGRFWLYDDDGETFAYERGEYQWREVEMGLDADGNRQATLSPPDAGKPSSYGEITWRFLGDTH